ncbi:MAG: hypothetical protein AVDCRST_MAG74-2324 [uncultured Pyrinomonadaceae bacterium]|uniref:DinB-like domain-containing protein n=1 Tax=uncultured Pyrinomonadaceae bacterium TaxID=2283094 RepID=A0A6N3IZ32_9BACT|nr:MAG: hypothetical protein AVDCRST_MAG74-2324 [uncultured Pyrinomonadaceae bacterium]
MKSQIEIFDRQFSFLHSRSNELLKLISDDKLFQRPRELNQTYQMFSCGEYILRSAGKIEQTFGGITTRLWDDPFEWTLPEELSTAALIGEYLTEVERTRLKGFSLFSSDEDLRRELPAPEKLRTIFEILIETLARSEHFQGRAFAIFQMLSDEKLPRV